MRYLRWSRVVPKEGRHVMLALQTQDCLPLLVSPYAIVTSVQLSRVSHLPDNFRPPGPPLTSKLGKAGAGESGRYNAPGLPEVSGSFGVRGTMIIDNSIIEANGAFRITETSYDVDYASFQVSSNLSSQGCTFDASRNNTIYGASPTVMPASVDIPICLYLGLHT